MVRAHRFLVRSKAIMLEHAQHCIAAQRVEVVATIVVDLGRGNSSVYKIEKKNASEKGPSCPHFFLLFGLLSVEF